MLIVSQKFVTVAQLRTMGTSGAGGAAPRVYRPQAPRLSPPPVYRPAVQLSAGVQQAFAPRPLSQAVQPKFTILNVATKAKDEEEGSFESAFVPESKQKLKRSDLASVLNSLPQNPKYAGLKLQFSSKNRGTRKWDDLFAIAVLKKLSEWAEDGGSRKFDNWEHAVMQAAQSVSDMQPTTSASTVGLATTTTSSTGPGNASEKEKILEDYGEKNQKPVLLLFDACDLVCGKALGRYLTATDFQRIVNTNVSMHGGEGKGGAKANPTHMQRAAQVIRDEALSIAQTVTCAGPVATFIGLSSEGLLFVFLRRILGGSVQEGKCRMMLQSMQYLAPVCTKICLPRFSNRAIEKIKGAIVMGFWGVEPKIAVKICRELKSALHVLEAQPGLVLLDWEIRSGDAEFDLKFGVSESAPALFLEVESESGLFGNKATRQLRAASPVSTSSKKEKSSSPKKEKKELSGPEYYADRWSKKAKLFKQNGFEGTLFFMISPDPRLNEEQIQKILAIARKRYNTELNIVFSGGQQMLPIPVQPVVLTQLPIVSAATTTIPSNPLALTRPRSLSLGELSSPPPQTRPRSHSLDQSPKTGW